ncbi:hypothetical protein INTERNEXUS_204 [Bacillus phage vB_BspM_Internexus]|nr:hypothetical protein INTERNEXUS_204 [Bacillus phage vB_BspM_Internexus]
MNKRYNKRYNKNEQLANELRDFIIENEFTNVRIYFNNKVYDWYSSSKEPILINNIRPTEYFPTANNKTVSMSFEGNLYYPMNFGDNDNDFTTYNTIKSIFKKYGYYFEFGNAWNITAYDL